MEASDEHGQATKSLLAGDERHEKTSSLESELSNIELNLSMTASRESLLDELLGDIRRSCATSLASTPTLSLSFSDASEQDLDNVFDCKLRRSETELRTLDVAELKGISDILLREIEYSSSLLVRLLQVKDKRTLKASRQEDRLSAILRDYACKNGLCTELSFSLRPPNSPESHQTWINAWKVLSRLPRGIPKAWRRILWSGLVSISAVSSLDWPSIASSVFSEYTMPGDEALGIQIVKDLHRTGDTGFTSSEEHALLKRVLLAYARFNKSIGYCQGFNILAALILKVVGFDELLALKIMIHVIDYILPENYFAQNLYALSVDMAAFRELLKHTLPELSLHIENLQRGASGVIKKSYSSECPPDINSINAYEPPLADVFTMQWFLTIFASALPRKATRRVWDLMFLEGSEMLLHTGVAIMAVMEKDLLQTSTAADFYSTMARLGERLRKSHLLPSAEFMQVVYTIQECVSVSASSILPIKQLREKYAYNICPCADPENDELAELQQKNSRPCPKPSRGGAFSLVSLGGRGSGMSSSGNKEKRTSQNFKEKEGAKKEVFVDGQRNPALPVKDLSANPVKDQIKMLQEHYQVTASQPAVIRCNIDLAPPQARFTCPQTKSATPQKYMVYGPDVPDEVVEKSKILSGQLTLEKLTKQKNKVFTLTGTQPYVRNVAESGMELGLESRLSKFTDFQGHSGILGNTAGTKGRKYLLAHEKFRKPIGMY